MKLEFVNKVVKQGNSLCVRIPSSIAKDGTLRVGDDVTISITPHEELYEYNAKSIEALLTISKTIPSLDKYSNDKKRLFLGLIWRWLKKTHNGRNEKQQEILTKEIKEEFGDTILKEWISFSTIFNKVAFDNEDNTSVLKPSFRHLLR